MNGAISWRSRRERRLSVREGGKGLMQWSLSRTQVGTGGGARVGSLWLGSPSSSRHCSGASWWRDTRSGWGIRPCSCFPREKTNPTELRVLVIGDSVVFGGALLNDSETSTALLAADLSVTTGRPVFVGNVAAGSWGPQNELSYLERFGAFDADAIVVVWSSHDAWDVPSFGPLGAEQPTEAPRSALVELITRYVWPRITSSGNGAVALAPTQQQIEEGLASAGALLNWIRSRGIPVAVVLHKTRSELGNPKVKHYESLRAVAEQAGVPVYESESVLGPAVARGEGVFTDDIHPSAAGQVLIAELYARIVSDLLGGAGRDSRGEGPGGR